jgi:hypothetical protein
MAEGYQVETGRSTPQIWKNTFYSNRWSLLSFLFRNIVIRFHAGTMYRIFTLNFPLERPLLVKNICKTGPKYRTVVPYGRQINQWLDGVLVNKLVISKQRKKLAAKRTEWMNKSG